MICLSSEMEDSKTKVRAGGGGLENILPALLSLVDTDKKDAGKQIVITGGSTPILLYFDS